MDEKLLIEYILKDGVNRAINVLGIEGSLEAIEHLILPIQRANMRRVYFELLKERGLK